MRGLEGSRVILIDDDQDDALPILKAFSRRGVSVAYFDDKLASLPPKSKRLSGVRLAILDMQLVPGQPAESVVPTLVQHFSRVISPDNGPYAVILWTNHPELGDKAKARIFEHSELPKPVSVVLLKKANFMKGAIDNKVFRLRKLARTLFAETLNSSPLDCLLVWERLAFNAASRVTNSVAKAANAEAANLGEWQKAWQQEAQRLLLAISKARAEARHSADNCIPELLLALNPLQADRMDMLVDDIPDDLSEHVSGIMAATGEAKVERRARVNTMLHLASDGLDRFAAGNLYAFPKGRKPSFMPSLKDVLESAVDGKGDTRKQNLAKLTESARLCAVEISPVCDHAQEKLGLGKLIAGCLVPHDDAKLLKGGSGGFLKPIGPFSLEGAKLLGEIPFRLILNSRFVASAQIKELKNLHPIARVRGPLLADVQVWTSYQGSRQGVMLVQ